MIRRADDPETVTTAVTIMRGAVGGHVGIRYATGHGPRHMHLAFHHDLRDEAWSSSSSSWVTPGFSDPLGMVRSLAALVAKRHADGAVPYALRAADAAVDPSTGEVQLKTSIGLTCSSLVLLIFKHAGVLLIDEATWETGRTAERVAEDQAAQKKLVVYLLDRAPLHAAAVEREVGCARIRAEEVAAASASTTTVSYGDVVEFAAALLEQLP